MRPSRAEGPELDSGRLTHRAENAGSVARPDSDPTGRRATEDVELDKAVRAARVGAEWALSILYREVQPSLLRYLRARAPGDEEDLASEIWLEVAQLLADFEDGFEGLRRLVFTVARWRVLDHARRRARRRDDPVDSPVIAAFSGGLGAEQIVIDRLVNEKAIERIVSLLPPAQAEVILLRVIGGFSVGEVAEITGRRPGAVRVLQHKALRQLARRLRSDGGEVATTSGEE